MDRQLTWLQRVKAITILSILFLIFLMGIYAIRNLRRLNLELTERLYTDDLTGLQSRYALEERGVGEREALILLDILNFNEINDLYGMQMGDEALRKVAERLKRYVPRERIFHISGDTFGVLFDTGGMGEGELRTHAERVLHWLESDPYEIRHILFRLRVAVGVARGANALHEAMIALDEAKQQTHPVILYDGEKRNFLQKIQNTRMMQKLMLEALEEDRILPFFQPIVDGVGRVAHWEALMRITLEEREVLPDFEAAIRGRIYPRLSRRMIEKVFGYLDTYPAVSINLGYEDICNKELVDDLARMIVESGKGDALTFELLESSSIDDYRIIEEFVRRFRAFGVHFAIDDFGSDYSNLLRTLRLSPDYLKIDGTLIRNVVDDSVAVAAVRSIVAYAGSLGIRTVAEYVSDGEIAAKCRELGIDLFQGYYFSEPLDPRKVSDVPKNYGFDR
jgi:diguanylate cyclase (GGDEF)-like protein